MSVNAGLNNRVRQHDNTTTVLTETIYELGMTAGHGSVQNAGTKYNNTVMVSD